MIQLTNEQQECVKQIKEFKHCFVRMATGTGKTFTSLAVMDGNVTVVCTNKESKAQWVESIERFEFEYKYSVYTYHELSNSDNFILYENLIFDEASALINNSKRARQMGKRIRQRSYNYLLAMSASPIAKDDRDIYKIASKLQMQIPLFQNFTYKQFMDAYFESELQFLFYKNKYEKVYTEFREEFRDIYLEQINVVNLEHTRFKKHYQTIELIKPTLDLYNTVRKDKILPGYYTTLSAASRLNFLRQITNSTTTVHGKVDDDYLLKIAEIDKIIEKHGSTMIIYSYKSELDLLMEHYPNGTLEIEKLKNGESNILFRHIQRSKSINIPYTNCMIFFSLNYTAEDFIQMHGRIERLDSKYDELFYYYLKFTNTVESMIYDVVHKKVSKNNLLNY